MAAISPSGCGDPEYLGNVLLGKETLTMEKHGHLPPILTQRTGSGSTSSSVESEVGRESSSDPVDLEPTQSRKMQAKDRHFRDNVDASVSRLGKRRGSLKLNEIGSNVNADNKTVEVNSNVETGCEDEEAASPSNHISDSELKFVFTDAKKNSRRSSEPELRSYFIRGMQDMSLSDVSSFLYPGGEDSENLRKSIRRNLPSDIVAETDEDEVETDSSKNRITNFSIDRSPVSQPRAKLSSISESDQDGEHKEDMAAQDILSFEAGCKEGLEPMNDIHKFKDKKSFKLLRHRRKSDGDVLLFDNTRKFSREDRYQPGKSTKSGGGVPLAASRMRYNCVNKSRDRPDIWQDMRECRYLRGYDPPEMNEPDEAVKFVFGHRNKD